MRQTLRVFALLSTIGSLAPATAFAAIDKQACLAAYEDTQRLRKQGKLIEAKSKSLVCAQDGCPGAVRDDCTAWSVDIDKSTPTITIVVSDGDGKDVTDASAFIDGEKVSSHLDGKAIAIDPGTHKVRIEREGFDPLEQDVVAHEGEKNRTVAMKYPKKGGDEAGAVAGPAQPPTMVPRPIPVTTWIFGGLAVAGVAGFTVFGLSGSSKKSDLDSANCKPNCNKDDVDSAKQSFLLADLSLGVAVVSAGLAAVFYFTRGEEPAPRPSAAPAAAKMQIPQVGVSFGREFSGATFRVAF